MNLTDPKNYKLLINFLVCFYSLITFSQELTLKGQVTNLQQQPIEFLTAILLENDSVPIAKVNTDDKGNFSLTAKAGNYNFILEQFGKQYYRKAVFLHQDIDLKHIKIDESQMLEEISIVTQKKLFESKVDRLVFNVQNSIVSQGTDALEVIRATPKIDVTQSGIKIIGKSSVGVLINGKKIQLQGADLENYLRSIRSENIKAIEIITIPPAKYDAQGNSGLLNIVLKKQPINSGFNGSATFSYTQRQKPSYSPSVNFNYSKKKFIVDFGFSHNRENKLPIGNSSLEFPNSNREYSFARQDKDIGTSANINMQYNLNDNSKIGLAYAASFWDSSLNITNSAYYYSQAALDSLQISPSLNKSKYDFHTLSGYYDIELDELGKSINITANYLTKVDKSQQDITNTTYFDTNFDRVLNTAESTNFTNTEFDVFTLNADINLPLEIMDVSFGAKYTNAKTKTRNKYDNLFTEHSVLLDSLKDKFNYTEQIFALYLSLEKEFDNGLHAQVGLRYEYTYNNRESVYLKQVSKNNFSNLFPSVFVSYNPNDDHSFSFAYSKRIERPSFYELNPYRVYSNYNSYEAGNPALEPSISHNLELSYMFLDNLYVTIYDSYLKKSQGYLTIASDVSQEIISRPENYFNQNTIGLDAGYNIKFAAWFNSYNSASFYFNYAKSYLKDITNLKQKGTGLYFSSKNTITIYKPKDLKIMINFFQDFPTTESFIKSYNRASLDFGFTMALIDKKLQLNASYTDIFKQNRNRISESYPDYLYSSLIYNDIRKLNISLNYVFGNSQKKKKIKQNNIEEAQRI